MASHKTFIASGFTLVETTLVLGMLAIVGSLALFVSMQSYSGYSFHATDQLLVTMLQKARSQALAGVCIGVGCSSSVPHGVHVAQNELVLFEGSAYNSADPANVYVPLQNPNITFGGMSDVVFTQLTADVALPGTITFADTAGHLSTVTLGAEGQISWSK